MNERVAAVEPNGNNAGNNHPTEPGGSRATGDPEVRFTYPSGSRPLEGFTLKRGVGQGGFGEVYFATSDAGKEVALKLIRRNFDVELRGIRHCLNLKHPNLLAVFDIREDEKDDKWVVMEFVSGERMDEAIAAHPDGMPAEQALAWVHGVGAGVAYLHDHGIVHRDLKPGNIFCDEGVVKLGDYGLSKFISCSRRSGQTESVGTVHYMAPEVANGRYGKEIDIYALGIILYEMLTGRVPFDGESVGEVLMKHLTAKPDVSMLAQPYRSVIARALEKDPAKRFGNVSELLSALPEPADPQVRAGAWSSATRAAASGAAAGAIPVATPVPEVTAADEEPILAWVRQTCRKACLAWEESNLDTPTKIILLIAGLCLLSFTAGGWMPLAVFVLVAYGCYWVVRAIVLSVSPPRHRRDTYFSTDYEPALDSPPRGQGSPPPKPSPARAAGPPAQPVEQGGSPFGRAGHRHRVRQATMPHWARRERPADVLVLKSKRERVTELIGSMLAGALVAITMCVVMVMLYSFKSGVIQPPQLWAWLMLSSVVGAWAVLIPSKFWEGSRGEVLVRRFVLMVVGLAVGVLAFGLAALLKVNLPYDPGFAEPHKYVLPGFYAGGTPLLLAYMACFGTLFVAIRWWRQADPLRATRMSLWAMIFCVVMGWLVAALWLFPQPWLAMVACAISVSVQLTSPWLHPRRRHPTSRFD